MLYIIPLTEIVLKAVVATVNTSLNHLHWSYLFEYDAKKLAIISVIAYVVDTKFNNWIPCSHVSVQ